MNEDSEDIERPTIMTLWSGKLRMVPEGYMVVPADRVEALQQYVKAMAVHSTNHTAQTMAAAFQRAVFEARRLAEGEEGGAEDE